MEVTISSLELIKDYIDFNKLGELEEFIEGAPKGIYKIKREGTQSLINIFRTIKDVYHALSEINENLNQKKIENVKIKEFDFLLFDTSELMDSLNKNFLWIKPFISSSRYERELVDKKEHIDNFFVNLSSLNTSIFDAKKSIKEISTLMVHLKASKLINNSESTDYTLIKIEIDKLNHIESVLSNYFNNEKKIKKECIVLFDKYIKVHKDIVNRTENTALLNEAERELSHYRENTKISNFLVNKNTVHQKGYKIKLSKAQHIEEIIIMQDNSMILKSKDGYYSPSKDNEIYPKIAKTIAEDLIAFQLRTKPLLIKPFTSKMIEENYNIIDAFSCIKLFLINEFTIKNLSVDIIDIIKNNTLKESEGIINKKKLSNSYTNK